MEEGAETDVYNAPMLRLTPLAMLLSGCAFISLDDHQERRSELRDVDTGTETVDMPGFDLVVDAVVPPGMSECGTQQVQVEATVNGAWAGETVAVSYRFDEGDWIDAGDVVVQDAFGGQAAITASFVANPPPPGPDCGTGACPHDLDIGVSAAGIEEDAPAPVKFAVVPSLAPIVEDGGLVSADATFVNWADLAPSDNPAASFNTSEYPVVALAINHPLISGPGILSFRLAACPEGIDPRVSDAECVNQEGNPENSISGMIQQADLFIGFDTAPFTTPACDRLDTLWNLWLQSEGDPCEPLRYTDLGTPGIRFVHDDCDGDLSTVADGDCDDGNPDVSPSSPEICDGLDNDCNTYVDEGFDGDGDGFISCTDDCDDDNADIHPGAIEQCDGLDNDCDPGTVESGTAAIGGASFATIQEALNAVQPGEYVGICAGNHNGDLVSSGTVSVRGAGSTATILEGSGTRAVWTHSGGNLDLTGLQITGGDGFEGGGIDGYSMLPTDGVTLTDVLVEANVAALGGGGVHAPNVTLNNSSIVGNEASNGGGIYTDGLLVMDLTSHVSENTASGYGGGIFAATVEGGLVQSNEAAYGGGIAGRDSLTVFGATLVDDNQALLANGGDGGGIHCDPCAAGGLSINGINVANNNADGFGGGLYLGDGAASGIVNSDFTSNEANGGGAIQLRNGDTVSITGATFVGNTSGGNGGAIGSDLNALTLGATTFTGNVAGTEGGALFFFGMGSNLNVTGATFDGNTAGSGGGAIRTSDGTVNSIQSSDFSNNSADNAGAILAEGEMEISMCDFVSNHAVYGRGGAIWVDAAGNTEPATISNGEMTNNTATEAGGAAWFHGGESTVTSVEFDGNSANQGGAILVEDHYLTLNACTLVNNLGVNGGAMAVGALADMDADGTDWGTPGVDDNAMDDILCIPSAATYRYETEALVCCDEASCDTFCL